MGINPTDSAKYISALKSTMTATQGSWHKNAVHQSPFLGQTLQQTTNGLLKQNTQTTSTKHDDGLFAAQLPIREQSVPPQLVDNPFAAQGQLSQLPKPTDLNIDPFSTQH